MRTGATGGATSPLRPLQQARRALVVIPGVVLALLLGAPPASAEPQWIAGLSESSTVLNCTSVVLGAPRTEAGITVQTDFLADPANVPKVGDVFYARVLAGAVGNPCVDVQQVHFEVFPPSGVQPAISPSTPVKCTYNVMPTPAEWYSQQPQQGLFGAAAFFRNVAGSPLWALPPGDFFELQVPLRSSRPLTGLPGKPSCARPARGGPCPPETAGDFLQIGVAVADGNDSPFLTPSIGLTVQPGSGGAGPGAPAPPPGGGPGGGTAPGGGPAPGRLLSVRASARIATALRGLPVTVRVPAAGATVRLTLTGRVRGLRSRTLMRAVVRGAAAGPLRVRLRPTARTARALRRARRVSARLRVRVEAPGAAARTDSARITLRR